ncbi:MAG TPA: nucleotide exchange factor GrpE [Firmicutes bacterium]|nr:nucleotide exchange factor GrpE [Bacillota bacterium]HBX24799.1 nucleotide exchange factor GrpE [Bacillota bacterium]
MRKQCRYCLMYLGNWMSILQTKNRKEHKKTMAEEKNAQASNEAEENKEETSSPEKDGKLFGKKVSKEKYEEVCAQLEKEKSDKEHWKNEYYKAYADTQNLRKSLEEENRVAVRYRAEGFLADLLPALDGFHMALETPPTSEETKNYLVGFKYIYNQIIKTLVDEGVSELSPKKGDDYDMNYMHAVDTVEDDSISPGKIVKVYSKGYKLHDRLIRPAMVAVAKASKQDDKKEGENKEEKNESEAAKA